MRTKTYKYYQDSGHGWLAVKRSELIKLGIIAEISSFSYERGKTVYLEEDNDLSLFFAKKLELNEDYNIEEKHVNGNSPIRFYPDFCLRIKEIPH